MGMSDVVRVYADKEIAIGYDARRCVHAAECTRGLPAVFDDARRPWIVPGGASSDEIAAVIAKCPSGALHFTQLDGGAVEPLPEDNTIVPTPRGPLYVRGHIQLRSADGSLIVEDTRLALCRCGLSHNKPFCDAGGQGQYQATSGELCRCGGSGNKPFCDGTHERIGFRSEES